MDSNKSMELLKKAKEGDQEAKSELVSLNLGLVWSIVKRFTNRGYEIEDLFQIGSIGLLKAIEKFDFSYNVKFSTYAVPMIIGEIRRYIRDDRPIKMTRSLRDFSIKIQNAKERLAKELNREPTIAELAEELGATPEELVVGLEAAQPIISLNDVAFQEDGSPIYYMDQLNSDEHHQNQWLDTIALKEALSKLDKLERQIIILRYFKDKTQTEVAKILGITQVQVSRLERKILAKIRNMLTL
ncbi:RNA polymerase sporulation sigma factor SigF [Thermosediminibacter oceani]|uniref:RNA polymerase sigma factor n=1 Tax=Thermosediminibacter oceani (strain ATCC BAA-1034 / DSM 16646 / JW/IW-1228P) TaxID=555079 RepID=D9S3P6_THEOJ|nr:RNA polymerase sporulation sigma factor SigF [Thermosediminibacter oceani]ADL08023.1 RNA polymerase, sigma subunit, RpoX/SigF [Thermosediminibacter oceani DSM 16646]